MFWRLSKYLWCRDRPCIDTYSLLTFRDTVLISVTGWTDLRQRCERAVWTRDTMERIYVFDHSTLSAINHIFLVYLRRTDMLLHRQWLKLFIRWSAPPSAPWLKTAASELLSSEGHAARHDDEPAGAVHSRIFLNHKQPLLLSLHRSCESYLRFNHTLEGFQYNIITCTESCLSQAEHDASWYGSFILWCGRQCLRLERSNEMRSRRRISAAGAQQARRYLLHRPSKE